MKPDSLLKPIEMLFVEDSPTDILLAKDALEVSKVLNTLHIAMDGVEALAFLRKEGKYKVAPRPELILLDLNLPKKRMVVRFWPKSRPTKI